MEAVALSRGEGDERVHVAKRKLRALSFRFTAPRRTGLIDAVPYAVVIGPTAILLPKEETAMLDSVIDGRAEDQGGICDLHHLAFACDYELMAASDLEMQESDELEELGASAGPASEPTLRTYA